MVIGWFAYISDIFGRCHKEPSPPCPGWLRYHGNGRSLRLSVLNCKDGPIAGGPSTAAPSCSLIYSFITLLVGSGCGRVDVRTATQACWEDRRDAVRSYETKRWRSCRLALSTWAWSYCCFLRLPLCRSVRLYAPQLSLCLFISVLVSLL